MSNTVWHGDASIYSVASDEWSPSSAFDKQAQGYVTLGTTNAPNTGQSSSGEGNVELVLHTPCSVAFSSYTVTSRGDQSHLAAAQSPAKMGVYGSTDGSSWTELGSYSGETSWGLGEAKTFSANSTLGLFNYFKFDIRKVSGSSDTAACVSDIELIGVVSDLCADSASHNCDGNATCTNAGSSFTCACNSGFTGDGVSSCSALTVIPPSDIGRGDTWTKDATVTHNSIYTLYKDYSGSVCSGRYRVKTNTDWFAQTGSGVAFSANEWPPSGIFDGNIATNNEKSGFVTGLPQPGTDAGSDADVQAILQTPCLFVLHQYAVQGRSGAGESIQNPSKMSVSGSYDCSGTWTELGSFEGEINWVSEETRTFRADSTLGAFNCFRFTAKRISQGADSHLAIGDIQLFGTEETNVAISYSDIGTGTSWTKDPSVTYNGVKTVYKDYAGSVCPGRFRAMSNVEWWDDNSWYSYGSAERPRAHSSTTRRTLGSAVWTISRT
uniref:EGF-like domain-containing protein n=1 Tax=Chromera velia CCMP2878 TaxID=1169474 RepID=A0A0G4GSL2_9ALVE|eukprot:Cvel_23215.t1-p1 / transcript=Cvel_23215.t1 / gene=Cvel_23215 / organism=Chromera_velia_CCMP2878 / gene_product=hypothetical protein / transcript_product=hypothetical protein / location=Cvel_scaffold2367:15776-18033(-) / protein_length=493 / sequence_SO=supercontig / SO=protein_coding / is_pseudo=false